MEKITMIYESDYDGKNSTDLQRIETSTADKDNCGLCATDVCQMFESFMESVGFSIERVNNYFR